MLLMIDNYDSFTYNLVHLFEELGAEVRVFRNDAITVEEAEALAPTQLVISPGPGRPADAGISVELIRRLGPRVPTLGVCLGHQAIVEAFGGEVGQAQRAPARQVVARRARRQGRLRGPARARSRQAATTRSPRSQIPDELEVTARTPDGEVMGVRHRELPIEGVQFHPESVLTPLGPDLGRNFLGVIQAALAELLDGRDLARAQAREVMDEIMRGEATQAQIGGFLVALRLKGETADEIAGCAEAMRGARARASGRSATTSSTRPAPAATARARSTSRPRRRSSRRRRAPASRSTATAPSRRRPARPTCSRRSASRSSSPSSGSSSRSTSSASASCSRPRTTRRCGTRRPCGGSSPRVPCSTCSARSRTPPARGRR